MNVILFSSWVTIRKGVCSSKSHDAIFQVATEYIFLSKCYHRQSMNKFITPNTSPFQLVINDDAISHAGHPSIGSLRNH